MSCEGIVDGILQWVWQKIVIFRGAVAAIAIVALLDGVLGWDRVHFLEFTHALIVHWNHWMGVILSPLNKLLPWFPHPSAININLGMLSLSLVPFFLAALLGYSNKWIAVIGILLSLAMPLVMLFVYDTSTMSQTVIIAMQIGLLFFVACFVFYAFVMPYIFSSNHKVAFLYAQSLLFSLLFIATLEALFYLPLLEEYGAKFVVASEALSKPES